MGSLEEGEWRGEGMEQDVKREGLLSELGMEEESSVSSTC